MMPPSQTVFTPCSRTWSCGSHLLAGMVGKTDISKTSLAIFPTWISWGGKQIPVNKVSPQLPIEQLPTVYTIHYSYLCCTV